MNDTAYMKRALELAAGGSGFVNPNPLVGAVIVKNDHIIGEGCHEFYGGPHAEINAFASAAGDVAGACLYVTLEPCSHYGKTPPCAQTVIEKGISRVVIAMEDPNPLVAGRGIKMLKDSKVEVISGVLEDESKKLNEIFIKYITTGLPFCMLKTAMTLDGKTATHTGDSKWITNAEARAYVHSLRQRYSAIMVGIGTVLEDDPFLNTRLPGLAVSDPVRIIADTHARLPLEANVINQNSSAGAILATTELAPKEKLDRLKGKNIEIIVTPLKDNRVDLNYLMKALGERNLDSVLLEGGSELNYSALHSGIIDKVTVFIAPKIIGGNKSKTPVGGTGSAFMKDASLFNRTTLHRLGDDFMLEAYPRKE